MNREADTQARTVLPWLENPSRLVSWWEMHNCASHKLFLGGIIIENLKQRINDIPRGQVSLVGVRLRPADYAKIATDLAQLEGAFAEVGLSYSVRMIGLLKQDVSRSDATISISEVVTRIGEVQRSVSCELMEHLFMYVPLERRDFYLRPLAGWENVVTRFPTTMNDIEESSRCFACDLYGAAVFHAMLVVEFGVIQLARLLGVEGDKPGWGSLDRLERILKKSYPDRSKLEQTHSTLLTHLLPFLLAVKNSWRHKVSHVDNKLEWFDTVFNPQLAKDIIDATRAFMDRLAIDLPYEDEK